MTEDEAKTKWCPMAREYHCLGDYELPPHNRVIIGESDSHIKVSSKCVASDCMMWRWTIEPSPSIPMCTVDRDGKKIAGSEYRTIEITGEGYCGLAGKP